MGTEPPEVIVISDDGGSELHRHGGGTPGARHRAAAESGPGIDRESLMARLGR